MTSMLYETLKNMAISIDKEEYYLELVCCCIKDANPHIIQDIYNIVGVKDAVVKAVQSGTMDIKTAREPHELLITLLNAIGDNQ